MLTARIDRLPPDEKHLLQVASVVGKDVTLGLLQSVADVPSEALRRSLDHLQAAEFVYELRLSPDPEYSFKHALTHEVAYGSLLQDRRREIHARVVDAIETLHANRLTEHVERLAHHAHRGALGEKAVHYLWQAGLKATGRSALEDARAWLEQALEVLEGLPESHTTLEQGCDIRLNFYPVLIQLAKSVPLLGRLREAMTLAGRLGDERRQGQVGMFMTNVHAAQGRLDEALATGARTLEIADRLGDLKVRIATTSFLVNAHHYRGDHDAAVDLALQNIATLPAEWLTETLGLATTISVFDRWLLVRSLADLGRFSEAGPYQAEAIRIAEEIRHPYSVGMAYFAAGSLHLRKGEWSAARSLMKHAIDVFLEASAILLLPPAVADCAWILAQLGESKDARARLHEAEGRIERHAERGIVAQRAWAYHALGRAYVLLGEVQQATQVATRAIECASGFHGHMAYTQHLLGDIATHPGRFDREDGEDHYHQALMIATDRRMRPLVAHCHLGLGRLYLRTGKREEARQHLSEAMTMYREMGMTFWLKQAEQEA
jgi:tetratricopeptide (TPR) repeat protein